MQLNVTLAGHTAAWRFAGSSRLERWLHAIPWQNGGGLRACRVRSPSLLPICSAASRQAVLAYDGGRSLIKVCVLSREAVSRSGPDAESLFLDRLEVADRISMFERLRDAARAIERRPTVFIVESGAPHIPTIERAEIFLDRIEKTGATSRPTLLVWALDDEQSHGSTDDFTLGAPVDGLLSPGFRTANELWRPYVHLRLAWETGGDLGRALRWDREREPSDVPSGRDDLLEALLNRAAQAEFQAVSGDLREVLTKALTVSMPSGVHFSRGPVSLTKMESAGLMWSPDGGPLRPTPWAARALLLSGVLGVPASQLRGYMICTPLARELLFSCFSLEIWERARCLDMLPPDEYAPPEARAAWDSFERGEPDSEYPHYPPNCPAAPRSAWCFASFGQILNSLTGSADRRHRDRQHDLRRLRNSLAHGHYVSWKSIIMHHSLIRELGYSSKMDN